MATGRDLLRWLVGGLAGVMLWAASSVVLAEDDLEGKLQQLEQMMQRAGLSVPTFRNLKLVAKEKGPFVGMEALVYDAVVEHDGRSVPQRIVFFTDKGRRYVVLGSILDLNERRDVGEQIVYRSISSELSLALLQRVPLLPGKSRRTVSVVVDLGEPGGRNFISDLMARRHEFGAAVELALVSNAQDEASVGAQAIIAGSHSTPFFYEALAQWLKDGKKAAFMDKDRLRSDPELMARLGRGIFHIEHNTTALLKANVRRLPLIFVSEDGKTRLVKPPAAAAQWCDIFGCGAQQR